MCLVQILVLISLVHNFITHERQRTLPWPISCSWLCELQPMYSVQADLAQLLSNHRKSNQVLCILMNFDLKKNKLKMCHQNNKMWDVSRFLKRCNRNNLLFSLLTLWFLKRNFFFFLRCTAFWHGKRVATISVYMNWYFMVIHIFDANWID